MSRRYVRRGDVVDWKRCRIRIHCFRVKLRLNKKRFVHTYTFRHLFVSMNCWKLGRRMDDTLLSWHIDRTGCVGLCQISIPLRL